MKQSTSDLLEGKLFSGFHTGTSTHAATKKWRGALSDVRLNWWTIFFFAVTVFVKQTFVWHTETSRPALWLTQFCFWWAGIGVPRRKKRPGREAGHDLHQILGVEMTSVSSCALVVCRGTALAWPYLQNAEDSLFLTPMIRKTLKRKIFNVAMSPLAHVCFGFVANFFFNIKGK
jgi:hypothetical protein